MDCLPPAIAVEVRYNNPRTESTSKFSTTGTVPGTSPLSDDSKLAASSSWGHASFGIAGEILGIRGGGRGIGIPYDDWASLHIADAIGSTSEVSAKVLSLDTLDSPAQGGIVVRSNMAGGNTSYAPPYVGLFITAEGSVVFQYASSGNGKLDTIVTSVPGIALPVCLRIAVKNSSSVASYSTAEDCTQWTELEGAASLGSYQTLDAGLVVSSGGGFREATGLFTQFSHT